MFGPLFDSDWYVLVSLEVLMYRSHCRSMAALCIALFATWTMPTPALASNIGKGQTHLDSGALLCDGQPHQQTWTAPAQVAIRYIDIWIGADKGEISDLYTTVIVQSATMPIGYVLHRFNWDHYLDPSGPHQRDRSWSADDAIVLQAGERVVVEHRCEAFSPPPAHSRSSVIMDWEQR